MANGAPGRWLLASGLPAFRETQLKEVARGGSAVLYAEGRLLDACTFGVPGCRIGVMGDVLPRFGVAADSGSGPAGLVAELYQRHGVDFVRQVKGDFCILLATPSEIAIYCDRAGVRRLFYREHEDGILLTNDLRLLLGRSEPELDGLSLASHAAMHHFVGGATAFRGVRQTEPSAWLRFGERHSFDQHWDFGALLGLEQRRLTLAEFAHRFAELIRHRIEWYSPRRVAMTLTGGLDSRMILAALLSKGVRPQTYTYGDPESGDAVVAGRVAATFGLEHGVRAWSTQNASAYGRHAWKVVEQGGGLAHLHRAHRVAALEEQVAAAGRPDVLLIGALGGEANRGVHLGDLIVTEYVRRRWREGLAPKQILTALLERYFFRPEAVDLERLTDLLEAQRLLRHDPKTNEFYAVFDLVCAAHHARDVALYSMRIPHVYPVFMDEDYLELLFSSPFSMLHYDNMSASQLRRLDVPELGSRVIAQLSPQLARMQLSKGYSPREYMMGRIPYAVVRTVRRRLAPRRPETYPYGDWFRNFIEDTLPESTEGAMAEIFDLERVRYSLATDQQGRDELSWRPFSDVAFTYMVARTFVPVGHSSVTRSVMSEASTLSDTAGEGTS